VQGNFEQTWGGRSHNPSSHDLWPHQEKQGIHERCGGRYRDCTPLLVGSEWWVELITEKSPAHGLKKMSPFATR
jgi:hypothetical protein